jgi:enoyl-[acyl-carrier-protein] reductase (NADH)
MLEVPNAGVMRLGPESGDFLAEQNLLPVSMLEADDVASAVAFLVSDEARHITGVQFPVDAGLAIA